MTGVQTCALPICNAAQQAPQVQPYPPYPAPYPPAAMPASADNGSLAKLQLLGQLHEAVRERTLTVYTNVAKVIAALQIRSPETITILLVDRSGQISWRSEGVYAADKGAGLTQALAAGSG